MNTEDNFNLMICAFRQMKGDRKQIAALLSTALNNTKWGTYRKHGITADALELVRSNRVEYGDADTYRWFKNIEAAHETAKAEYCLKLVSEDMKNPFAYLLETDRCILATKSENKIGGHDHFSHIYPLDHTLFGHGASNFVLKRHHKYDEFLTLLENAHAR